MKKILFLIFCIFSGIYYSAGKTISVNGVAYDVVKQNNKYYVLVTVGSQFNFLAEPKPIMMLKTFNNNVITLNGLLSSTKSGLAIGYRIANTPMTITPQYTTVQFEITEKQFEYFNRGISKIRLSTIPKEYEKTFKKDKLGYKLYRQYQVLKNVKNKDSAF